MKRQLVGLSVIREEFKKSGRSIKHLTRNIRKAGFTLHRMSGLLGRSKYGLFKEDAKKYLELFVKSVPEKRASRIKINAEESVRQSRASEGWISFKLSAAGMPDLINLKLKEDGSFDVLFEEVKGPSDGVRKEQYFVLEEMKRMKIPVVTTWID